MKVEFLNYSELPESQHETAKAICYYDFETAKYLVITDKSGKVVFLESDSIEGGDARFDRDLSWVRHVVELAYLMGVRGE